MLALEHPAAPGCRYLLQSAEWHYADVASRLRAQPAFARLPALPVDAPGGVAACLPPQLAFDSRKVYNELGVTRIAVEDSLAESAASLARFGHAESESEPPPPP